MQRTLLTAILRNSSGFSTIDAEAGVIRGVKLMELGKLARFAGDNGQAKQVTITDEHISALLAHAGNRAIPIHDSHEWFDAQTGPNADSVEMNARIGALKAFRKDATGNLIADAHLNKAKSAAMDFLWGAESNPEDNCFSVVFSYLKDDPKCIPQNFRAGDRVPAGAATTALFSQSKPESMDPKELAAAIIAALSDKEHGPALKTALLTAYTADEVKPPTQEQIDQLEKDAGVIDEDRMATDTQVPALMRANVRIARSISRRTKSLADSKTAILAEAKIQAGAEATALLGKGGYLKQGDLNEGLDATAKFNAAVKELTDKGVKLATATQTIVDREPALYNEMNSALFRKPSTL